MNNHNKIDNRKKDDLETSTDTIMELQTQTQPQAQTQVANETSRITNTNDPVSLPPSPHAHPSHDNQQTILMTNLPAKSKGKFLCTGCRRPLEKGHLLKQRAIKNDEIEKWKHVFSHITEDDIQSRVCRICRDRVNGAKKRCTTSSDNSCKRQKTIKSTEGMKRIKLTDTLHSRISKLKGNQTFLQVIEKMIDVYEHHLEQSQFKQEPLLMTSNISNTRHIQCATCRFFNGNIATTKVEVADGCVQTEEPSISETIKTISNLEFVDNRICFRARESDKQFGKLSLPMEYLSAKLASKQLLPIKINTILTTIFDVLGIQILGNLPSKEQHTIIMYRYVIYSDLYFLRRTEGRSFTAILDDFTRKYKANQVFCLASQAPDGTTENHIADISRIFHKDVKCKMHALLETRDYFAYLQRIEVQSLTNDDCDILLRIHAKQSDRYVVEELLGEELDTYVKEHGKTGVVAIYCAAHCANSAVEAGSSRRSPDGQAYHDMGYRLCRSMINFYRQNKSVRGYIQQTTGKLFFFSKESASRFYQNMTDMKTIFELIDVFKGAIEIQEQYEIATQKLPKKETIELKTMINCDEHITCLWVNVIEVCKLLRPYLQLLSKMKGAFQFFHALLSVVETMRGISKSPENFVFNENVHVYDEEYVMENMPMMRTNIKKELALKHIKTTLNAWTEVLDKVLVDFKAGGKYSNPDTDRKLEFVPAVSCAAESVVGSSSVSRWQAPGASTHFHRCRIKLTRNLFPPLSFIRALSVHDKQTINRYVHEEIMKNRERRVSELEAMVELSRVRQVIMNHEQKKMKENVESSVPPTTDRLEPINHHQADSLKGKRLLEYLKAYNIKRTGTADDQRFKLKTCLMFLEMTEQEKEQVRVNVNKIIGTPTNVFQQSINEIKSNADIAYDPETNITSMMMDWEACYPSETFPRSQLKRPGGKQFYQAAKVNIFKGRSFSAYARRSYIKQIPGTQPRITADSPVIKNALMPNQVMEAWVRFDEQLNAYGNVLLLYWASTYFDVNMLRDALEEAGLKNQPFVTYGNALKLFKMLIPGLQSYCLEDVHRVLGFGQYDAHNALDDCLAAWRCLLFAVHCYMGVSEQLTEDSFHTTVLYLLEKFDAYLCEYDADDEDSSQQHLDNIEASESDIVVTNSMELNC